MGKWVDKQMAVIWDTMILMWQNNNDRSTRQTVAAGSVGIVTLT